MANAKPFLKWAGGKGQLLEQLDLLLPKDFSHRKELVYIEPFVGGAAMLFYVLEKYPITRAIINDSNSNLITCYKVIKENPVALIEVLERFKKEYQSKVNDEERKELYYEKRERYNSRPTDDIEMAALFIFLNKTGFNGLYRVNAKGGFNVPFNKAKNPPICDSTTILADSEALQNVEILNGDFEAVIEDVDSDSFLYFDPPYRPLSQTAAFTSYSKDGFDDEQQKRLADFCRKIDSQGHQWLLSNSDPHNTDPNDNFFDDLYKGFDIHRVSATRMINSNANGRGRITELAIRNYKE